MKPKKLILIIGGIVVAAIVLCVAGSLLAPKMVGGNMAALLTPTPGGTPTELSVRARGELVPARWADLAFELSGQVTEWFVAEGDTVKAGEPLGRLATAQLEQALTQAQLSQRIAEERLAQAQADHERQLREAELAVQSAEARLAQARARYPGLTQAEINLNRAKTEEAEAEKAVVEAQKTAEWQLDFAREAYYDRLQKAREERQIAEAALKSARGEQSASSQELHILEGEVERAKLELAKLQQGVDPTLQQEVERARLQTAQAQADLDAATLRAPFAGTVIQLHLKALDWAQPGAPAVTFADLSTLQVETTDLDEWGMARIQVGDEARIVVTAFDDKTLTGHIAGIALRGQQAGGSNDMTYKTIITLDQPDPDLRWGMTVRITIPLEQP